MMHKSVRCIFQLLTHYERAMLSYNMLSRYQNAAVPLAYHVFCSLQLQLQAFRLY